MKKVENETIVLLTDSYPYDTKETFLEPELFYLSRYFKKIYIVPLRKSEIRRAVPENVEVLDIFSQKRVSILKRIFLTFINKNFYKSIINDFPYSISISYIKLNFVWSFNTSLMYKSLYELILSLNLEFSKTIFYAYFFTSSANALALLKDNYNELKIVTRVHGGDLYENVLGFSTFPLRKFSLKRLDKIFSISENGVMHLKNKYNYTNVILSRLGVFSIGKSKNENKNNEISIVSCSNIIPLKRVYLILLIIKELDYKKITWTHFGKGKDKKLDKLLNDIDKKIIINIKGQCKNEDILNFYLNNSIDVFINVSTSEGVPVSIMEAMSASIPVIATNVGGTSEIVKDGYNGFLLDKNFDINDAVNKINKIKSSYYKLSENAYNTWLINFNAETNHRNFSNYLKKI